MPLERVPRLPDLPGMGAPGGGSSRRRGETGGWRFFTRDGRRSGGRWGGGRGRGLGRLIWLGRRGVRAELIDGAGRAPGIRRRGIRRRGVRGRGIRGGRRGRRSTWRHGRRGREGNPGRHADRGISATRATARLGRAATVGDRPIPGFAVASGRLGRRARFPCRPIRPRTRARRQYRRRARGGLAWTCLLVARRGGLERVRRGHVVGGTRRRARRIGGRSPDRLQRATAG